MIDSYSLTGEKKKGTCGPTKTDYVSFVLLSLVLEVTMSRQVRSNALVEVEIPMNENDIAEDLSGLDGDSEYNPSEDDLFNKDDESCFDR